MILVVDTGTTKTQAAFLNGGNIHFFEEFRGINFANSRPAEIDSWWSALKNASRIIAPQRWKKIIVYGAGVTSENRSTIPEFSGAEVYFYSDLLGSARAGLGTEKGIAIILGTGSNAGFYDGKEISKKVGTLGYLLGDEGSGYALGRKILQNYFRGFLEKEVSDRIETLSGVPASEFLPTLYKSPEPRKKIAGFSRIISEFPGYEKLISLAKGEIERFFMAQIQPLNVPAGTPVSVTGTVGFYLKHIVEEQIASSGLKLARIIRFPIENLVKFHAK